MNLENVFGQIEPDGANIFHGTVPPLWRSSNDHVLALDAVGAGRSTSSHTVAVCDGCTSIPLAAGRAQEDENLSRKRRFRPRIASVRRPGSVRTDHALRITGLDA